ncbi:MAG: cytochrome c3 family protein [bacterium]
MRVRLSEIKLRPTGKKVRLDRDLDVESLFIGRGPDNDLSLKGLTISLHQATIRMSDGRVYVEAAPGQEVNVNGLVTQGERLGVGDKLKIGPWEIRILDPGANADVSLEYEEIDRADSERAALDSRTKLGLETGLFARRPLAWAGVGGVLFAFLLLPLFWGGAQTPWNTGPVSRGHAYVEDDCQVCHSGFFRPVANADCMTCHHDIGRHAPADLAVADLEGARCADCHLEHRGREVSLADLGSGFCSDCHSDLSTRVPQTDLANASDFGSDHPPFEIALVTDPTEEAVSVELTPERIEVSGLEFSHLRHVGQAVTGRGDSKQYLQCGACHQPDAGGFYMKPIEFETHCQDCHRLDFDSTAPADLVPHGDPARIRERIRGFYSARVLNGEVKDAAAPRRLRLRRPGARLDRDEAELSRRWVEEKLAAAERRFFERPGTCDVCHTLSPGTASDGGMGISPVRIQEVWVPGSVFSHDSHAPFACVKCHPAAAVFDPEPESSLTRPSWSQPGMIPYELVAREPSTPVSEESGDILIPSIETCRECHAGAKASGGTKVPSPCSLCHPFHIRELGPMRSVQAEATEEPMPDSDLPAPPAEEVEDEPRRSNEASIDHDVHRNFFDQFNSGYVQSAL